jgi:N-acetylmuramate 1-kinase
MSGFVLNHLHAPSPEVTESFARSLSLWIRPGMVIALKGDLGAGKSIFARAFIRAVADQPELEVPSPTFSLIQTYDDLRVPLAHADLYRINRKEDAAELGLQELLRDHAVLIEWPENLHGLALVSDCLTLAFTGSGQARDIAVEAGSAWHSALSRDHDIETFLHDKTYADCQRRFLLGDASSRRYETLHLGDKQHVLMDMPDRPDGPPVRGGKTYSAIAHLAEGINAVIGMNRYLRGAGYSAPEILAEDVSHGLAVIEFLDGEVYGAMKLRGADMTEPMAAAVEVLADMARHDWPRTVPSTAGRTHTLHDYDLGAQLIEVDLLPSWFWPHLHGNPPPAELNQSFESVWRVLLPLSWPDKPQWVLRDYHSPNLIWMPQREGIKRVGIIDTQDALMGHAAYDLVSLLQDARVDVELPLQEKLYDHYVALRRAQGLFDEKSFAAAYAILGAQRSTKILGIFARLSKRDGKHGYLKHVPRMKRYLAHNLQHPALAPLKQWFDHHMPEAIVAT